MPTTVEMLTALPLFAGLDSPSLQGIAPHLQERICRPGDTIVLEGDPCQTLYLVARGLVRLRQFSTSGREYTLGYVEPGGCFDLPQALGGGNHRATADALTETLLLCLPCARLSPWLEVYPALAQAVAHILAAEVRRLSDRVRDLALYPVPARLARFLLAQADEHHTATAGRPLWTQELVATHIGSVRDVVGRVLRTFADEGLIRRERGRMVIVNREGLERLAEEG